ncbi:MAG: hypothetical protein KDM81_10035 [Verrucomicrobiae bacterium]|nr:hypothetical protein [Verrucomicrobiae bacterium]MCP5523018.1 hypothetical protein [Verrucomicrobiales bacterium]
MSLKAFHLLFIVVSILLALGFGVWELATYRDGGATVDLVMGSASLVAAVGLGFYLRAVLKKLKNVSYL